MTVLLLDRRDVAALVHVLGNHAFGYGEEGLRALEALRILSRWVREGETREHSADVAALASAGPMGVSGMDSGPSSNGRSTWRRSADDPAVADQ